MDNQISNDELSNIFKMKESIFDKSNHLYSALGVLLGIGSTIVITFYCLQLVRTFLPKENLSLTASLAVGLRFFPGPFIGGAIAGLLTKRRGVTAGFIVSICLSLPVSLLSILVLSVEVHYKNFWLTFAQLALSIISIFLAGMTGGWVGESVARRRKRGR